MKKKILVFIPTLDVGGAEKMCVTICNYLINSDPSLTVTIACLKAKGELTKELHPAIKLIDLDHPSVYLSIRKIISVTKKEKPDTVISWMGFLNAYVIFFKFLFPKNIKWLCRESSLPSRRNKYFKASLLFNFMYRFYNKYDAIICQSEAMANDLIKNFGVKAKNISIINNPLQLNSSEKNTGMPSPFLNTKYKLLYAGRLHSVKRIEILIDVIALLDEQYSLTIAGEGPEQNHLEGLVAQKQLTGKIKFTGLVNDLAYYYKNASCLLIASLYEGFPNVAIEAMSVGCPVIGYQMAGGADEILRNYGGIHLQQDSSISTFAEQIKIVCETNPFIKQKIIEECLSKYGLEKIGNKYYELIVNTTK